jgi:hypothetical protein
MNLTRLILDLDLPPSERFVKTGLLDEFNSTVWKFYNEHFANDTALTDALYGLVLKRGKEPAGIVFRNPS